MANDNRRQDQPIKQDKHELRPVEIADDDLDPVVGGLAIPGGGTGPTDPCLTAL